MVSPSPWKPIRKTCSTMEKARKIKSHASSPVAVPLQCFFLTPFREQSIPFKQTIFFKNFSSIPVLALFFSVTERTLYHLHRLSYLSQSRVLLTSHTSLVRYNTLWRWKETTTSSTIIKILRFRLWRTWNVILENISRKDLLNLNQIFLIPDTQLDQGYNDSFAFSRISSFIFPPCPLTRSFLFICFFRILFSNLFFL